MLDPAEKPLFRDDKRACMMRGDDRSATPCPWSQLSPEFYLTLSRGSFVYRCEAISCQVPCSGHQVRIAKAVKPAFTRKKGQQIDRNRPGMLLTTLSGMVNCDCTESLVLRCRQILLPTASATTSD